MWIKIDNQVFNAGCITNIGDITHVTREAFHRDKMDEYTTGNTVSDAPNIREWSFRLIRRSSVGVPQGQSTTRQA